MDCILRTFKRMQFLMSIEETENLVKLFKNHMKIIQTKDGRLFILMRRKLNLKQDLTQKPVSTETDHSTSSTE